MNIVSYRGPGMAGGVSTALASVWEENAGEGSWWYMKDSALQVAYNVDEEPSLVANLSQELIKGHYRFCNEFLWPVLHDLPEYATLRESDREHYQKFNEILSRLIAHSQTAKLDSTFFVQDYQLALMPHLLKRSCAGTTMVFWHVPWPKYLHNEYARVLAPIAKAMLGADVIGFHTSEYGENFLRFVDAHLPEFRCDFARMRVCPAEEPLSVFVPSSSYARERTLYAPSRSTRTSEVVVAPLGLDCHHWKSLATNARATFWQPWLAKRPYILSVDRADYTKGITYRLKAIDAFFDKYPDWRGKLVFAQVCGRTRAGIEAYDEYWDECRALENKLKQKWDMGHWQPLLWFDRPFSAAQLSLLYRNAAAMLVNPIRDGLNLTAKEYVACQGTKPGLLALSRGAGAWHELGKDCLEVEPEDPAHIADTIHRALNMTPQERALRMERLSRQVESNTLERWWERFSTPMRAKQAGVKAFSQLREIS
jgi:trehalose 6-phosphate synthase